MNVLQKMYKTDHDHETKGVDFQVAEGVVFTLRRFGGANSEEYKRAMAKHHKPYAHIISKGNLDPKLEEEIMIKIFVDVSLIGWKGVEWDGEELEFNRDNAVKLFKELPDLMQDLVTYATDFDNYRETLGNS